MEARKKVAGSISVYRGKAKQLSMSFHYHDCVLASGDFGQGFSITLLCYYEHYRTNGKLCYLKNTKLIFTPFDIPYGEGNYIFSLAFFQIYKVQCLPSVMTLSLEECIKGY